MLLFKTEQSVEKKIFDELTKKIRKSKNFAYEKHRCIIKCRLDSIDVAFDIVENKLTVKDKLENEIVVMDCAFDVLSKNQQARFSKFVQLLELARERADGEKLRKKVVNAIIQTKKLSGAVLSLHKLKSL